MTISELEERSRFAFNISEIIVPFSEVLKKREKGQNYEKLSELPTEEQLKSYKLLLLQELI